MRYLKILIVSIILLTSCTFTTTVRKDPAFAIDTDSLATSLRTVVVTKNINLDGTETKTNGKVSSELTVRIINGKNIPDDGNAIKELGKQVAQKIKLALKDPNEYNSYKVLFVVEETNGSLTKSHYVGRVYKSDEL